MRVVRQCCSPSLLHVGRHAQVLTTRSEPWHAATDCTQDAASESGAAGPQWLPAGSAACACFTTLTGRFFIWLHTASDPSEAPVTHCTTHGIASCHQIVHHGISTLHKRLLGVVHAEALLPCKEAVLDTRHVPLHSLKRNDTMPSGALRCCCCISAGEITCVAGAHHVTAAVHASAISACNLKKTLGYSQNVHHLRGCDVSHAVNR